MYISCFHQLHGDSNEKTLIKSMNLHIYKYKNFERKWKNIYNNDHRTTENQFFSYSLIKTYPVSKQEYSLHCSKCISGKKCQYDLVQKW